MYKYEDYNLGDTVLDLNYLKNSVYDISQLFVQQLNLRKNATAINTTAESNELEFHRFIEAHKIPSVVHWKDTLISKGKKHFPRKKYEYSRIVALGDIHGDYNKLKRILRHAKLIDDNNDWIGTDSILVQVVNFKF